MYYTAVYYTAVYYTAVYYTAVYYTVSVLGRDKGYTVKYNPLPEGVSKGEAQGIS